MPFFALGKNQQLHMIEQQTPRSNSLMLHFFHISFFMVQSTSFERLGVLFHLKINFMKYIYSLSFKKAIYTIALVLGLGFFMGLAAQTKPGTIAGKIIDKSNGEALIGATIQVEGSDSGTATDIEGNFTFEVNPGSYVLVCSYVSYQNQKIQVEVKSGEVTNLSVVMAEEVNACKKWLSLPLCKNPVHWLC
jgi:CarboxypepD_reg-like domain